VKPRRSRKLFFLWLRLQQLRPDAVGYFARRMFDTRPHPALRFMIVGDYRRLLLGAVKALIQFSEWAEANAR
jgi:hypothetical protein